MNSSNETIFVWILLNYGLYLDYVNIFSISIEYDLKVNWNWLHSDQLAKCHNPSPQLDCDRLSVLSSSIKMLGHGKKNLLFFKSLVKLSVRLSVSSSSPMVIQHHHVHYYHGGLTDWPSCPSMIWKCLKCVYHLKWVKRSLNLIHVWKKKHPISLKLSVALWKKEIFHLVTTKEIVASSFFLAIIIICL